MPDEMQGALERYEEGQREEKKAAKAALLALVDQLRIAGISEVIATFSGYGDEGSIEEIEFPAPCASLPLADSAYRPC